MTVMHIHNDHSGCRMYGKTHFGTCTSLQPYCLSPEINQITMIVHEKNPQGINWQDQKTFRCSPP